MKSIIKLLVYLILLASCQKTIAQKDTIVTNGGDTIFCEIKKVTEKEITYLYENYRKIILMEKVVYYTPQFTNEKEIWDIDVLNYETEIKDINLRMDKHWEEYKKGIIYNMMGSVLISIGTMVRYSKVDDNLEYFQIERKIKTKQYIGNTIVVIGGVVGSVGIYYTIHSHSVFGKKWRLYQFQMK
jgi:hypothetical protein